MKTCPYCGSEVEVYGKDYYCCFCEMAIECSDVQENGKRKNYLPESQPCIHDLHKTTPELMCFTTIELLYLLKFARNERSNIYHKRYVFIRAIKEGNQEFKDAEEYTYKEYEYWTRKCYVIENIIRERIGYIPYKVTDSYIKALAYRMSESAKKPMKIKKGQKVPF